MTHFTDILTNLLAFGFALGVIIIVHEAGHLLVAKAFGVRVLTFSVGFGRKIWGVQRGETEYRVSLVPLGGYVRLGGENPDEISDDPREFLNKPRWQRILVYLAGPAMNVLLSIILIAGLFMAGIEVMSLPDTPPVIGGVEPGTSAAQAGLQRGDLILKVKGEAVEDWNAVVLTLLASPDKPVPLTIRRGKGQPGEGGDAEARAALRRRRLRRPAAQHPAADHQGHRRRARGGGRLPPRRRDPRRGRPADRRQQGFRGGHLGPARPAGGDPAGARRQADDSAGGAPQRGRRRQDRRADRLLPALRAHPGGLRERALQRADRRGHLRILGKIFSRQMSAKSALAGPIEIAAQSGAAVRRGFKDLLLLMGFISMSIAIMNLMPIPILDGGQIFILSIEG